ncbi:MAG: Na+/H+ antiporter subunit E [Pseudomonadales bacterium]
MERKTVGYILSWGVALAAFWLLLSGYLKPLLLAFGLFSVVLVLYLLRRMDRLDDQPQKLSFSWSFFRYLVWLTGEIIVSSFAVTKLVWGKASKLSPTIDKLPIADTPEDTRVLYANSITLTPGTLSIDIDDKHVTVHALQEASLLSLKEGEMATKAATVTGEKS